MEALVEVREDIEDLEEQFAELRAAMVRQIEQHAALIPDCIGGDHLPAPVMAAMAGVPRHRFVPVDMQPFAYFDTPLPIGFDKTISQPFIVALMTDLLDIGPTDRVLEVGTGLGYQAAVLGRLAGRVFSIEIIEALAEGARRRLRECGVRNVRVMVGDGSRGLPEYGPYDRILVCAAPQLIPPALLAQLAPGGRMVIPAGADGAQQLLFVVRDEKGHLSTREILPVRFSALVTGG